MLPHRWPLASGAALGARGQLAGGKVPRFLRGIATVACVANGGFCFALQSFGKEDLKDVELCECDLQFSFPSLCLQALKRKKLSSCQCTRQQVLQPICNQIFAYGWTGWQRSVQIILFAPKWVTREVCSISGNSAWMWKKRWSNGFDVSIRSGHFWTSTYLQKMLGSAVTVTGDRLQHSRHWKLWMPRWGSDMVSGEAKFSSTILIHIWCMGGSLTFSYIFSHDGTIHRHVLNVFIIFIWFIFLMVPYGFHMVPWEMAPGGCDLPSSCVPQRLAALRHCRFHFASRGEWHRWIHHLGYQIVQSCPRPADEFWEMFQVSRYTVSDNSTWTYFNILKQVDRCSQSQMLKQIAETPIALTWHTAISKGLLVFVLLRTANKSIIKYNGRSRWHVHSTPPVPLFLTIHNRRASSVHCIGVWEEEVERSFR